MKAVRTVLGDIAPDTLGVCDAHDHLFIALPSLPGQELDDPPAAGAELAAFRDAGGSAVAQWTPFGLGRRAALLPALSRAAGVHVVAATGLHQARHYRPALLERLERLERSDEGGLAAFFSAELTDGLLDGDDPAGPRGTARAGMIKTAGMFHGLDGHARWVMEAAAEAHHATGAPIGVHHEHGTGAAEVVELLHGRLGVPADSLLLGHLNRFPDPGLHRELAASGAFLAFDGPSAAHHATDWRLVDGLAALAEAGHADRILVGGDTVVSGARASTGGGPGMPWLLRVLRPRLVAALGEQGARTVLVDNPARALAARWAPAPGRPAAPDAPDAPVP